MKDFKGIGFILDPTERGPTGPEDTSCSISQLGCVGHTGHVGYPVIDAFFALRENLFIGNILAEKGIDIKKVAGTGITEINYPVEKEEILQKKCESFFNKLLNYSDIRPLLIGIHPELDKMIHEKYKKEI